MAPNSLCSSLHYSCRIQVLYGRLPSMVTREELETKSKLVIPGTIQSPTCLVLKLPSPTGSMSRPDRAPSSRLSRWWAIIGRRRDAIVVHQMKAGRSKPRAPYFVVRSMAMESKIRPRVRKVKIDYRH